MVTLTDSTVSGNTGGGIINDRGAATLIGSIVSGNSGGGIINDHGNARVEDSAISGNTATAFGGADLATTAWRGLFWVPSVLVLVPLLRREPPLGVDQDVVEQLEAVGECTKARLALQQVLAKGRVLLYPGTDRVYPDPHGSCHHSQPRYLHQGFLRDALAEAQALAPGDHLIAVLLVIVGCRDTLPGRLPVPFHNRTVRASGYGATGLTANMW